MREEDEMGDEYTETIALRINRACQTTQRIKDTLDQYSSTSSMIQESSSMN